MASVKRRKDSRYWVCCFTLPNGERMQASSNTEDKNEALQKAFTYEKTSALARKKRLDEATARHVLKQIAMAAGHTGAADALSLREYLKEQRQLAEHQYKDRSLEKVLYALDHYRDESGLAGDGKAVASEPLHVVTPARAVEWRDSLVKEGLAAGTINFHLGTLRRAFAAAVQKEWLEKNPWDGLAIAGAEKKKQKRHAFTFAMFEHLLQATAAEAAKEEPAIEHAAEWHLLIRLGGYTGQRRTDCVQLAGEAVDFARGVVKFWRKKNKDFREVPMHPSLRSELAKAIEARGSGKLLPSLATLPLTGRKSVTDVFRQKVLPLIGIVQPYQKSEGPRTLAPYSFHSLRHALSTWLNDAGVSDPDRMQIVGHADKAVSHGYTHAGLKQAKRAIRKIPKAKR